MTVLAQRNINVQYSNSSLYDYRYFWTDSSSSLCDAPDLESNEIDGLSIYGSSIKNTEPFFQESRWERALSYLDEKSINIERWLSLYQLFKDKFEVRKGIFQHVSHDVVEIDFKKAAERIFDLRPDIVSVEVTEDECIFIYAEFQNRALFYNIFYDEEGREIQLNLIEDKKPVASISGDMDSALAELENFVGGHFGEESYAISGTLTAEI